MSHTEELRKIWTEALRVAEMAQDVAEETKALRDAATKKGLDWSQIKSLATAFTKDGADAGHRVDKLVRRAGFACDYAAMLKIGEDERERESRSSSDQDGSIPTFLRREGNGASA